jgi:hypothetical protein
MFPAASVPPSGENARAMTKTGNFLSSPELFGAPGTSRLATSPEARWSESVSPRRGRRAGCCAHRGPESFRPWKTPHTRIPLQFVPPCAGIPDSQHAIIWPLPVPDMGCDQRFAIRRKRRGPHFNGGQGEVVLHDPETRVPDFHMAIGLGDDQAFPVWEELRQEHPLLGIFAGRLKNLKRCLQLIDFTRLGLWDHIALGGCILDSRAVGSLCGGQLGSVWTVGHHPHSHLERAYFLVTGGVRQTHRAEHRDACQFPAIGREPEENLHHASFSMHLSGRVFMAQPGKLGVSRQTHTIY